MSSDSHAYTQSKATFAGQKSEQTNFAVVLKAAPGITTPDTLVKAAWEEQAGCPITGSDRHGR